MTNTENNLAIESTEEDSKSELVLWQKIALVSGLFIVLIVLFYFSPLSAGFDWGIIIAGSRRFVGGEEVYQRIEQYYGYYYAPWLTVVLAPLSFLPNNLSAAVMSSITLLGALALANRYKLGLVRTLLLLSSPPIFYCLLLGQIDVFVLLPLFLPKAVWAIAALTKPQTSIGIGLALLKHPKLWIRTIIVSLIILAISFLIFDNWIMKILVQQSFEQNTFARHNIFSGMWPFQAIVGLALVAIAFERDDERIYIASSPFLLPYASTSSFFGTLLAAFALSKTWQAAVIWGAWWGALLLSWFYWLREGVSLIGFGLSQEDGAGITWSEEASDKSGVGIMCQHGSSMAYSLDRMAKHSARRSGRRRTVE
jgi:hypothetical protein